MANANRTCEFDFEEAVFKLERFGNRHVTKNCEISKRIEFPHLYDRAGRFDKEPKYFIADIHSSMDQIEPEMVSHSERCSKKGIDSQRKNRIF